jgi:hypothetical protein
MTTDADVNDEEALSELLDELKEECSNYGAVREVHIPRPGEDQVGEVQFAMPFVSLCTLNNLSMFT